MKKTIFTVLCTLTALLYGINSANAQCQASFNVYQDTTIGAPLHHYWGDNTCIGANFPGIDTINYSYTWSWGDGTATTAPFPSHTYATTGNYTICLYMNAVPALGCNDTICINATINKNSAMATITIKNPNAVATSTKDIAQNQFSLFPNPASDKIFIKGLQNEKYNIAVFSIDGRLISSPALQNNEYVSIAELAKGNYMLKITNGNNNASVLKFFKD